MMRAVDHFSFTVSDMDRSIEFYTELLGEGPLAVGVESSKHAARVIGYDPVDFRYAWFGLPGSDLLLELFEYREPMKQVVPLENYHVGNGHMGLVVDDLDAEHARMSQHGATFTQPEPVAIVEGSWAGSKTIYMHDPDGITIEMIESPPGPAARFS